MIEKSRGFELGGMQLEPTPWKSVVGCGLFFSLFLLRRFLLAGTYPRPPFSQMGIHI
jgi:hypothetical protein